MNELMLMGGIGALTDCSVRARGKENTDQRGYEGPLVAVLGVELDNEALLLRREGAPLEGRAQVVDPPQPAALAVPQQTRVTMDRAPVPFPVPPHVLRQYRVLLRTPRPLLEDLMRPLLSTSSPATAVAAITLHSLGFSMRLLPPVISEPFTLLGMSMRCCISLVKERSGFRRREGWS